MTKERLKNYRRMKDELGQLSARLAECETALYSPKNQKLTEMPSAPSRGNAMEDMAIRHMQLQALYQRRCEELAAERSSSVTGLTRSPSRVIVSLDT